ncbi:hypothetical protein L9F63_011497, partial [Diploptera punctata]
KTLMLTNQKADTIITNFLAFYIFPLYIFLRQSSCTFLVTDVMSKIYMRRDEICTHNEATQLSSIVLP